MCIRDSLCTGRSNRQSGCYFDDGPSISLSGSWDGSEPQKRGESFQMEWIFKSIDRNCRFVRQFLYSRVDYAIYCFGWVIRKKIRPISCSGHGTVPTKKWDRRLCNDKIEKGEWWRGKQDRLLCVWVSKAFWSRWKKRISYYYTCLSGNRICDSGYICDRYESVSYTHLTLPTIAWV